MNEVDSMRARTMGVGCCPKCSERITRVMFENVLVGDGAGPPAWAGVSYVCPACHAVLGVGIDPIGLQAGVIDGIRQLLKKE